MALVMLYNNQEGFMKSRKATQQATMSTML
jgi:hypothetical protein